MADTQINISVPSLLEPIVNPAWLYVPLAGKVVPVAQSTIVSYYLQEDAIGRFLTEDDANLLILETNG